AERMPETMIEARRSPSTRKRRLFPVFVAASPMPIVSPVYQRPIRVKTSLRLQAGVTRAPAPARPGRAPPAPPRAARARLRPVPDPRARSATEEQLPLHFRRRISHREPQQEPVEL